MSASVKFAEGSPWTPFEDRRRARDEKREAVLRMAVRMFLEDGYHRTPLAKIAERLNITKPALYNYFRSKEDILRELYRQGDEQYEASFGRIERGDGDSLHKLREFIRAYARVMTTDRGMCFARLDDRELGEEARAEVRRSKRRYDLAFRKKIERGIEDGSILPCDAKLAAFVIGGALNGIADWYRPDGALSVATIANEFSLRLTEGLAATRTAARTSAAVESAPEDRKRLTRRDHPSDRRTPDTPGGDK
jgi:AcrR family transcriptional regulator